MEQCIGSDGCGYILGLFPALDLYGFEWDAIAFGGLLNYWHILGIERTLIWGELRCLR